MTVVLVSHIVCACLFLAALVAVARRRAADFAAAGFFGLLLSGGALAEVGTFAGAAGVIALGACVQGACGAKPSAASVVAALIGLSVGAHLLLSA